MHVSTSSISLAIATIVYTAPTQWGSYQSGGRTKLLGSALSLIGKDATYDNNNVSQIPAYHTVNSNAAPDPANVQPLIDWGIITAPQAVRAS